MLRFPNGVPAVADEDMSEWMIYVYKQFERPTNVAGVPVKIEIIDPNGEYAWIGTATTEWMETMDSMIIPEIEGKYMIMATLMVKSILWFHAYNICCSWSSNFTFSVQ